MTMYWKYNNENRYRLSHDFRDYFRKHSDVFDDIPTEYVEHYLGRTHIRFLKPVESVKNPWIRITLPFAIVTIIIMLLLMPIKYVVTGKWQYENKIILNWFHKLGM